MKLTDHIGKTCPTHPDAVVLYGLHGEAGVVRVQRAGDLYWGPGAGPNGEGRIAGWRMLVAPPCAPRGVGGRDRRIAEGTPWLHCETVIVG